MLTRICLAAIFGLVVVTSLNATSGNAAAVGIPAVAGAKRVTDGSQIGPNKFKPAMCANLTLTHLLVVDGASGYANNSAPTLIIGDGSQDQILSGGKSHDCIVAGGAGTWIRNTLEGDHGHDVLIGGKYAINAYDGGKGSDTCYYRSSDPVPASEDCEFRALMP